MASEAFVESFAGSRVGTQLRKEWEWDQKGETPIYFPIFIAPVPHPVPVGVGNFLRARLQMALIHPSDSRHSRATDIEPFDKWRAGRWV